MTLFDYVKKALGRTSNSFDDLIADTIGMAFADLGLTDIDIITDSDPNIKMAVTLYCKLHIGDLTDREYADTLKAYEELKKSLSMNSGYTFWGGATC